MISVNIWELSMTKQDQARDLRHAVIPDKTVVEACCLFHTAASIPTNGCHVRSTREEHGRGRTGHLYGGSFPSNYFESRKR